MGNVAHIEYDNRTCMKWYDREPKEIRVAILKKELSRKEKRDCIIMKLRFNRIKRNGGITVTSCMTNRILFPIETQSGISL
jgi:hypothetical protein